MPESNSPFSSGAKQRIADNKAPERRVQTQDLLAASETEDLEEAVNLIYMATGMEDPASDRGNVVDDSMAFLDQATWSASSSSQRVTTLATWIMWQGLSP